MDALRNLPRDIPGRTARESEQPAVTAADLTESMMGTFGHQLPLDLIAHTVHQVLDAHAHPHGAPVPAALRRAVVRRVRELTFVADPTLRPPLSQRAQAIARALAGGRA
jgi:hypothetical protein